jgi:hypothetical protein
MGQQHPLAVQVRDHGIGQETAARFPAEFAPDQKVTVAVKHKAADTGRGQGAKTVANARLSRVWVVVTNPGLEEVAQDVQGFRACSVSAQEFEELLARLRRACIEVHI